MKALSNNPKSRCPLSGVPLNTFGYPPACYNVQCSRCGWNPEVVDCRREAVREQLRQRRMHGATANT